MAKTRKDAPSFPFAEDSVRSELPPDKSTDGQDSLSDDRYNSADQGADLLGDVPTTRTATAAAVEGSSRIATTNSGTRKTSNTDSPDVRSSLDEISLPIRRSDDFSFDDQEIYIPVHGFVRFSEDEIAVLNHPALQRLGHIYQLGQAHLVFRGATHKRLEHCIGTLGAAGLIIDALERQERKRYRLHSETDGGVEYHDRRLTQAEQAFIRLAALTHDIGHLPSGHTLEDELGLLDAHDYLKRINLVLDRTIWYRYETTSTLRAVIDERYAKYLPPGCAFKPSELLIQINAKDPDDEKTFIEKCLKLDPRIRVVLCRDIVGNTICADLLDYLYRDWHHVGKPKHFDHRLLQYLEIKTDAHSQTDMFVVSLGQRPKIRHDAISGILDLLESRYQLSETVLFHRTKLAFAAMLERGVQELRDSKGEEWSNGLVELLLDTPDEGVVDVLLNHAVGTDSNAPSVPRAVVPLKALRSRRVYKHMFTRFSEEYPADVVGRLKLTYARRKPQDDTAASKMAAAREAAADRLQALRLLEDDFDLPKGSLAMYCPNSMNDKIAKVKIAIDEQIAPFDSWEDQPNRLSGGHLAAQRNRFNRLWRVHVFLEANEAARMERDEPQKMYLLKTAIRELVFPKNCDPEKLAGKARLLAWQATQIKEMKGFHGRMIAEGQAIAARKQARESHPLYPSGAPTLLSYLS